MDDSNVMNSEDGIPYAIHRMLVSSDFLEIEDYLCSASMYSILGRSNQEDWYSHFIAWLLNPCAMHNLGDFPLKCFLMMVRMRCDESHAGWNDLPPLHLIDVGEFKDLCVMPDCLNEDLDTELSISSRRGESKKGGELDIAMTSLITAKSCTKERGGADSRLLLVVENKVRNSEHKDDEGQYQTERYAEWAHRKFQSRKGKSTDDCPHFPLNDKKQYFDTPALGSSTYRVLVFLSAKREKPKSPKFIGVDYGDLVSMVILPVLAHPMISAKASLLIREFLREIVSNGYAYTPEIEVRLNGLLDVHGAALRKVYELCVLDWCESENWLGSDNSDQRHNFELNWMLHFCEKDWWAGKVSVHGDTIELTQNQIPITQKGHWVKLPDRPRDEKLWTKNAGMKVILCDGRNLTVSDCWKEYCDRGGIGEDGRVYAKMICAEKGYAFHKIARWITRGQHKGSAWYDLLEMWDSIGVYD